MFAGPDQNVLIAGIDADEAVRSLGVIGLGLTVARDPEQAESHLAQRAAGVAKGERKIAIDAVAHGAAFGAHAQRFDDGELAVLGNADVRIEGLDDFGGKDMAGGEQPAQQHGKPQKPAHRGAGFKATCGTARSAVSETSK